MHARRLVVLAGCAVVTGLVGWSLQAGATEQIDSYARCVADGNPTSDTNPPTCSSDSHVFLGPNQVLSATTGVPPDSLSTVDFQLLAQGDSAGTYPKRQQVITTQADWEAYWRNVHSALPKLPPLLPVDFLGSNVVALTEGVQQTDGYNLKITGITSSAAGTIVEVSESVPTVTCHVMYMRTDRYFLARTPRLREPVSFRITPRYRRCRAGSYLDNMPAQY